jgi:co-chaperonin GroES (HSP10)
MILKPNVDRIIVRVTREDMTESGRLWIPEQAKNEAPLHGEVVAKGSEITDYISIGDRACFGKYAAYEAPDGKVKNTNAAYFVITEGDILYTIEESNNV